MSKKKLSVYAENMATLRRNRVMGGGISRAVDFIMTSHEELIEALDDTIDYCNNNVAYFGEDEETAAMLDKAETALARACGAE